MNTQQSAAAQALERLNRISANFEQFQARQNERDATQATLQNVSAQADIVIAKHQQCEAIRDRIHAKIQRGPQ